MGSPLSRAWYVLILSDNLICSPQASDVLTMVTPQATTRQNMLSATSLRWASAADETSWKPTSGMSRQPMPATNGPSRDWPPSAQPLMVALPQMRLRLDLKLRRPSPARTTRSAL